MGDGDRRGESQASWIRSGSRDGFGGVGTATFVEGARVPGDCAAGKDGGPVIGRAVFLAYGNLFLFASGEALQGIGWLIGRCGADVDQVGGVRCLAGMVEAFAAGGSTWGCCGFGAVVGVGVGVGAAQ